MIIVTRPDVALAGTVAVIDVSELTVKLPLIPLNFTSVAPVKLVPLIVTLVPYMTEVGEIAEIATNVDGAKMMLWEAPDTTPVEALS